MRKRKHLLGILAVVIVCGLAATANAATVTLSLTNDATKVYAWAQVVGTGVEGISSFIIDLTAGPGVTLSGWTNKSPKGYNPDWNGGEGAEFGFKLFRSAGASGVGITAGQATAYGDNPSALLDQLVIQGVGQTAGSSYNASWAYPVLLAQADYSTTTGGWVYVSLGTGAFNLLTSSSPWTGPGNVQAATSVSGASLYIVPEPATMALMGLGLVATVMLRKRR